MCSPMVGHLERMENDRIANRVYVGECAGSRSVSKLRKRWTDTVIDILKTIGSDVKQVRRMGHDRNFLAKKKTRRKE